jgi:anti-sigma-K factor RskA
MNDATDHSGLPEDELVAAELALGVLSGAERMAALERATRDRAFARMVAAWEERLAPWAGEIEEVAPPPRVWDAIAGALPAQRQRTGLWQSLAFWRGLTFATGTLAAVCLGVLVYLGTFSTQAPLVTTIDGGGRRHFIATIDAQHTTIAVAPAGFTNDPTRVPELWLIPADGKPRPLGLLRSDQTVTIAIPASLVPYATRDAALAVSLEPPGGSPTGQPTGPVIGSGKLTNL